MTTAASHPACLIQEGATGRWLDFGGPRALVVARALDEVRPTLARVAAAVEGGRWAAGFLSYEAAPAFDSALVAHAPDGFPLLWFALYDAPPTVRDTLGAAPDAPPALGWQPTVDEETYRATRLLLANSVRGVWRVARWLR